MSKFWVIWVGLSKFVSQHTDIFHALSFFTRFLSHGQSLEFAHRLVCKRMFRLFSVFWKTLGTSVEQASMKFIAGVFLVTVSVQNVSGSRESYFSPIQGVLYVDTLVSISKYWMDD